MNHSKFLVSRSLLIGAALGAAACVSACGSSNHKRHALPYEADAGADSGSGGAASTGGRSGSTGGSGAGPSSGGAAPVDASTEAGSPEAGRDASIDAAPEASTQPVDAGWVCHAEAGAGDAARMWRDFAGGVCRACPGSTSIGCADLLAAPGPSYDPGTQVLTLHLTPGIAELVSATISTDVFVTLADGGYEYRHLAVPGKIDRNTVTFDTSTVPESLYTWSNLQVQLLDACGVSTDVSPATGYSLYVAPSQLPDGGGSPFVACTGGF